MRKMFIDQKKIASDIGKSLTLTYSVTIDELSDSSSYTGFESYGLAIGIEENGEELCIRHITLRSCEIMALATTISSNCVTPATLPDVIDDWICR